MIEKISEIITKQEYKAHKAHKVILVHKAYKANEDLTEHMVYKVHQESLNSLMERMYIWFKPTAQL